MQSNNTWLGSYCKLYCKFGSRDLLNILHDHGYTVTHDEVKRFGKLAAKYVNENAASSGDGLH